MLYRVTLCIATASTNRVEDLPISAVSREEAASSAKSFMESKYWNSYRTEAKVEVIAIEPSHPSEWR